MAGNRGERWGTVLHSDVWSKFQKRPEGTTECHLSSSSVLTCWTTLENDRTNCPVENTAQGLTYVGLELSIKISTVVFLRWGDTLEVGLRRVVLATRIERLLIQSNV